MTEILDTLIVGGGPAGLSAAIHLAWHERRVLVVDRRTGPLFFTLETLWNVPGMPEVRGVELIKRLRRQAEELGSQHVQANVVRAERDGERFRLDGEQGETWFARTVLLATGVARYHPTVDGDYRPCFKYAGKGNMYYCPDCEAPLVRDKSTLVIAVGPADWAGHMAMGLTDYTERIRVLLTGDRDLSPEMSERLSARGIEILAGDIQQLLGHKGRLSGLRLKDGRRLEAEAFFVSSPALGRTRLAQQLGVEMASTGHHAQPRSQRGDTNVTGVWVAGDLRPMSQQVAVAMGTGNIAALMIDQYLTRRDLES